MKAMTLFSRLIGPCLLGVATMSASSVRAMPISDFFTFGAAAGDTAMVACDDCTQRVQQPGFNWSFYGNTYNHLYLNNNGSVSFNTGVSTWNGSAFPASTVPIIAPYWADVDTRAPVAGNGNKLWYHAVNGTMGAGATASLQAASSVINDYFLGFDGFTATQAFFATWDRVGYYSNQSNQLNTFQLALVTNGSSTFAIFNYLDDGINWLRGSVSNTDPQVGFDAGDLVNFYNVPGSRTLQMANLETMSNTIPADPGRMIFNIGGTQIVPASPTSAPEPAAFSLLAVAVMGLLARARSRRSS